MTQPMSLPHGFRVRLARGVLTADAGRVLVGGSPLTAMRLSGRADDYLRNGSVTVTDDASALLAERLLATNLGQPDLANLAPVPAEDVTVVIPVRDRPHQLDRALTALHPLRCIVVDDQSLAPQQVADVARRHDAQLIALQVNVGPAGARNAGLAAVTTPYVAFVDSDVEVTTANLLALTRHFADRAVSLVGPRVTGITRSARPRWFETYDAAASSLTLGNTAGVVRPGAAVAWLPSACLIGRTSSLADGFDESLRIGEDVDLVWRLVDAGHRVRYDPTVEAHHDTRATIRGWLGRKYLYGTGGADLASRHGSKLAPAVLTPTYALAGAALLTRSRWALPITALALARGTRSIRSALPRATGSDAVAARLAVRGLGWALRQESALLLRHWWPAAAVGGLASRSVRRALLSAIVIDSALAVHENQRRRTRVALPGLLAGRRLDDLAYGGGLWTGAIGARSTLPLRPRSPGTESPVRPRGRHSARVDAARPDAPVAEPAGLSRPRRPATLLRAHGARRCRVCRTPCAGATRLSVR